MAEKLKIISLGGLNEIGKNMTVYEYGERHHRGGRGHGLSRTTTCTASTWSSPTSPTSSRTRTSIRGIFLTHGHEDHIGAMPYVLRDINAPIYATRMTAGLVKLKLEEHRLLDKTKLITCEAGEVVRAGKFSVEFIHVNHSIADAVAFAIKTARWALCVHTGDFKIDPTPISGRHDRPGPPGRSWARRACWPCCATPPTWSAPATPRASAAWATAFDALFKGCDERIIVTTFASNVDRIQQIINVAAKYGRKVAVTGRSMENAMKVSTELGYMNVPEGTAGGR